MQVVVMPDGTEVEFPNPKTGKTSEQLLEELKNAEKSVYQTAGEMRGNGYW